MVKTPETAKQIGKLRGKNNLYLMATLVALAIVSVGVSIPLEQADARPCDLSGSGIGGTCSDTQEAVFYMIGAAREVDDGDTGSGWIKEVGMDRGYGWGVHFVGAEPNYDDGGTLFDMSLSAPQDGFGWTLHFVGAEPNYDDGGMIFEGQL